MVQRCQAPPPPPHPMASPLPPCGSLWCGFHPAPPPCGCGRLRPLPWLLLVWHPVAEVWTLGCDTVLLNSDLPCAPKPMIVMNTMVMIMTKMTMVVKIPIRTLLRSLAQESRMKIMQTRAQAYF